MFEQADECGVERGSVVCVFEFGEADLATLFVDDRSELVGWFSLDFDYAFEFCHICVGVLVETGYFVCFPPLRRRAVLVASYRTMSVSVCLGNSVVSVVFGVILFESLLM